MNDQTQELQWISAARRGDADAFESLVHLYEKRVFSLALRMCGNQEDAAEAAQEAFLAAWQALPFFRGESSFSTWLYRLTQDQSNYKMASVIGILVFIVCAILTLLAFNRMIRGDKEENFQ